MGWLAFPIERSSRGGLFRRFGSHESSSVQWVLKLLYFFEDLYSAPKQGPCSRAALRPCRSVSPRSCVPKAVRGNVPGACLTSKSGAGAGAWRLTAAAVSGQKQRVRFGRPLDSARARFGRPWERKIGLMGLQHVCMMFCPCSGTSMCLHLRCSGC